MEYMIQQARMLEPIRWLAGKFLRPQTARLRRVVLFSFAAALLQSASYMMLRPVLQYLANDSQDVKVGPLVLQPTPEVLMVTMGLILIFMITAIQARYQTQVQAIQAYRDATPVLAAEGILHCLEPLRGDSSAPEMDAKKLLSLLTRKMPMVAGLALRNLALTIPDTIQAVLFMLVLFWLQPTLTTAFLLISLVAGIQFLRSFYVVVQLAEARQKLSKNKSQQPDEMGQLVDRLSHDPDALRRELLHAFSGSMGGSIVRNRTHMQIGRKRGPLWIEHLFPVALVMLAIVALAADLLQGLSANLIIYLLVLRHVVTSMRSFSSRFISVGRYYPYIAALHRLMTTRDGWNRLGELSGGADDDEDDD